jgi:hypothetical protein
MENTNIEYFNSQLKKFVKDISTTFPEYNGVLNSYYSDLLNNDTCNDDKYVKRFMRKTKDIKTQISKKESSIFEEDIFILKNVNFRELWNKEDFSKTNRDSIWDYIQMLFVIGQTIISDTSKINDLMAQFKSMRDGEEEESQPTIQDEAMLDMLKNLSDSSNVGNNNIDENLLKDGMIGKLAEELSSEINMDLNIDENDTNSVNDVFSNLMNGDNPMKFMNLIQTVGSKIQNKVSSGELNQEKLLEEAQSMMGMLTNNNPLLNNLFNPMQQEQQQQSSCDNPTRDRLRKKLNNRKNK